MAVDEIGGYDADFVEEVPKRLECPVCLLAYREPYLLNCCGRKVCSSCLRSIGVQRCPLCREEFQSMSDPELSKEVLQLKVYCSKKSEGCKWTGELGQLQEHVGEGGNCEYLPVACPNGCGQMVPRKLIDEHSLEECSKKPAGGADFTLLKKVYKAQLEEVKAEMKSMLFTQVDAMKENMVDEQKKIEENIAEKNESAKAEMQEQKNELLTQVDTMKEKVSVLENTVDEQKSKIIALEENIAEKQKELDIYKEDILLLKEGNPMGGDKPTKFTVQSGGFETGCCAKFFINGVRIPHRSGRGINVVVLDPISYKCVASNSFDTNAVGSSSSDLVSFISSKKKGSVIGVAVMDDGSKKLSDAGKAIIDQIGGDQIYHLKYHQSYALIAVYGCPDFSLQVGNKEVASVASYLLPPGGTASICSGERYVVKATSCGLHGGGFATVEASTSGTTFKFSSLNQGKRGIYLGLVNYSTQTVTTKTYDTHSSDRESASLSTKLISNDVRSANIVAMAVIDTATNKMTEQLRYQLEGYGSCHHKDMLHGGSWVLIGRWEREEDTIELVHRSAKLAVAATYLINE